MKREFDRVLALKPTQADGRHLRDAMFLDARDKLLRSSAEATWSPPATPPTGAAPIRHLPLSLGVELYADICSVVATARRAGRSALAAIRNAIARPADLAGA